MDHFTSPLKHFNEHINVTLSARPASPRATCPQKLPVSFHVPPCFGDTVSCQFLSKPFLTRGPHTHPPRACDALSSAHARLPPLILHVEGWRSRPQKSSPVFHSLNEALLLSSITVTTYVCEEHSFHASLSPPLDCKLHGGEDSVLALDFQSQQAQGCVRLRQVGCHDTVPETRGLSNRNRILPVLELQVRDQGAITVSSW